MTENKIQSIQILPSMSPNQATVLGVVSFSFEMNRRLSEQKEKEDLTWHMPLLVNEQVLKEQFKEAVEKEDMVEVACMAMKLFHRKRMETFECE